MRFFDNRIDVLSKLKPYLRLIKAYNIENFSHTNWQCLLRSVCNAFGATLIIISMPMFIILGTWYLIENDADLKKFVVALPLLISLLMMTLIFIALMVKNRVITEIIDRLQRTVDQSEFFCTFFLNILVVVVVVAVVAVAIVIIDVALGT